LVPKGVTSCVGQIAMAPRDLPRDLNDSKHWRDRAAEMRVLANDMKEPKARAMVLSLADDYDKLADRAAERARRRAKAPSPIRRSGSLPI